MGGCLRALATLLVVAAAIWVAACGDDADDPAQTASTFQATVATACGELEADVRSALNAAREAVAQKDTRGLGHAYSEWADLLDDLVSAIEMAPDPENQEAARDDFLRILNAEAKLLKEAVSAYLASDEKRGNKLVLSLQELNVSATERSKELGLGECEFSA